MGEEHTSSRELALNYVLPCDIVCLQGQAGDLAGHLLFTGLIRVLRVGHDKQERLAPICGLRSIISRKIAVRMFSGSLFAEFK